MQYLWFEIEENWFLDAVENKERLEQSIGRNVMTVTFYDRKCAVHNFLWREVYCPELSKAGSVMSETFYGVKCDVGNYLWQEV